MVHNSIAAAAWRAAGTEAVNIAVQQLEAETESMRARLAAMLLSVYLNRKTIKKLLPAYCLPFIAPYLLGLAIAAA